MAVRNFPGSAGVTLAAGGAAGVPAGAWTVATIIKPAVLDSYQVLIGLGSAIVNLGLWITASGGVQAVAGGFNAPIELPLTGEWLLVAISKTAGEAAPRGHLYRYSTGTWTHLDSGNTLSDQGTVTTIDLGNTGNDWYYTGHMAVAGVWDAALSDPQVETLESSLRAWLDTGAVAVWPLDQDSTSIPVIDITGGGADQTATSGTSVVTGDDPPGFDWSLGGGGEPVGVPVGSAAETDTALVLGRFKLHPTAPVIETSQARSVARRARRVAALATETSVVLGAARDKTWTLGLAAEVGTALPVLLPGRRLVGVAIETDAARSVAVAGGARPRGTGGRSLSVPEPGRVDWTMLAGRIVGGAHEHTRRW